MMQYADVGSFKVGQMFWSYESAKEFHNANVESLGEATGHERHERLGRRGKFDEAAHVLGGR